MTMPFFSGSLGYGPRSDVGLCTLWSPKYAFRSLLPHYGVVGNLYSRYGIGVLMRNVLATPSLRYLVITGTDRTGTGEMLMQRTVAPDDVWLSEEQIVDFYRRVQLVDARHTSIWDVLPSLPVLPPVGDATIIPLPSVTTETYPAPRAGFCVRANTIAEAHRQILTLIRRFGHMTAEDKEGHARQELWQLTVCLPPTAEPMVPGVPMDEVMRYGNGLWYGDDPGDLTYRYGHTMRHRYGDQIAEAIAILRRKHESFRSVITLWEPLESMRRDDEPCLITVHPRLRDGVLDLFVYIRTNDMYRGWPMNAAGVRILQQYLATALDAEVGDLTTTSGSAHLYSYDLPSVDRYLDGLPKPKIDFVDPYGDWHIYRRHGEYCADHYQHGRLLQTMTARNEVQLLRQIAPFVGTIAHALWIGQAVAHAEEVEKGV